MTTSELLALLEEDEVDWWLRRGDLRFRGRGARDPHHAGATAALTGLLGRWLRERPAPRGRLYCDCLFRIRTAPDTTLNIDVAYLAAGVAAATPKGAEYVDGLPVLAAEILSPEDTADEVAELVQEYLTAGVKLVWVVDPDPETVVVYRLDSLPVLFKVDGTLTADPYLPGLTIPVAEIFE